MADEGMTIPGDLAIELMHEIHERRRTFLANAALSRRAAGGSQTQVDDARIQAKLEWARMNPALERLRIRCALYSVNDRSVSGRAS